MADSPQAAYPSLKAFYAANEIRRRSPEADFGVWWVKDRGPGHYRVSYVQATGEVYAIRLAPDGAVEVLGIVPPDPDERRPNGVAYGKHYYRTLNRVLDGWPEHCGQPGGWSGYGKG